MRKDLLLATAAIVAVAGFYGAIYYGFLPNRDQKIKEVQNSFEDELRELDRYHHKLSFKWMDDFNKGIYNDETDIDGNGVVDLQELKDSLFQLNENRKWMIIRHSQEKELSR